MKKLVEVVEVEGECMESLLGQRVMLMCANYFYVGKLEGVNDKFVRLADPAIVYETGAWTNATYTDVQRMNVAYWNVERSAIESWGLSK